MRKTKFRGKSVLNNEWREGDFVSETKEFNRTCDKAYILPFWEKLNTPIAVIPESVGQFTGLTDANDVDVFEKDIISHRGIQYEIVFVDGAFYANQQGTDYHALLCEFGDFIVVGNTIDHAKHLN